MEGEKSGNRELYTKRVYEYEQVINQVLKHEQNILSLIKKDTFGAAYKRLVLADEMIYLATLYLAKFRLSVALLGGKNENILNEARKTLYKPIIYLEEIVTDLIDAPFSEYEEGVAQISKITEKQRYYLIRKLGLVINLVIDAYGENTKWRWSFIDIEARFAVVAKNIMDLKEISKTGLNPLAEDYDTVIYHLRLVKKLFTKAADKYREKYEIVTNNISDFRTAILFLEGLRRVHMVLNEHREVEEIKRKIEIWKDKMEKDLKQKDKPKK
ncbi:hypothetical protein E4O03_07040 [Treponema sp. OMZ 792]|uniref:hypothetical protein n=1 Tax=unclassified Treponema TaxID=2638727 RepID=UPI0020A45898|nr:MULTISPECIES: hypothetical protein [unclassified Treponema]UTC74010.1 hypothetical protein E4O03_07040 [Treponema sp. OMZ 792]UTC77703.1 hypothetical protein E4O04_06690 [Treponema sp. OMZ 799]UTC80410.1 hypothetical protein E4O07_06940 [Treponema sp. OMZ 798]